MIVLLEDNDERRAAMIAALGSLAPDFPLKCFDIAPGLIAKLDQLLPRAVLFSLDHDLGPARNGIDPGVGRDVAQSLALHAPVCPVIIHSTNVTGASAMKFDLDNAGWNVTLIAPYGDLEWIQQSWFPTVRKLLRHA